MVRESSKAVQHIAQAVEKISIGAEETKRMMFTVADLSNKTVTAVSKSDTELNKFKV